MRVAAVFTIINNQYGPPVLRIPSLSGNYRVKSVPGERAQSGEGRASPAAAGFTAPPTANRSPHQPQRKLVLYSLGMSPPAPRKCRPASGASANDRANFRGLTQASSLSCRAGFPPARYPLRLTARSGNDLTLTVMLQLVPAEQPDQIPPDLRLPVIHPKKSGKYS